MGVEFSAAVGYGFIVSEVGLAHADELDGPDGDGATEWLNNHLPETLIAIDAGSYWTGRTQTGIFIESTLSEMTDNEIEGFISLKDYDDVQWSELVDLEEAQQEFDSTSNESGLLYAGLYF